MPRKQHSYHYIYKTTCKVTGRFYIGMHSTSNLEDGYLGSGTRLGHSIRKWGRENHVREILEFLSDRSSLKEREKNLVNEDLLQDPRCMNLQIGGGGGFVNEEHKRKFLVAGKLAFRTRLQNDPEFKKFISESASERNRENFKKGVRDFHNFKCDWNGRTHSELTKERIRSKNKISQAGYRNSQYGTIWITNEKENKKWKKDVTIPDGWRKGRKKSSTF